MVLLSALRCGSDPREMVQLVLRLKGYLIERHDGRVSRTLEEIVKDSYADETR